MEKNIQIHEMLPGNLCAGNPWQKTMVENTILRRDEPYYMTVSGETFYTGNAGEPVEKKIRRGFFSRIFRRETKQKERISVWKKSIA